MAFVATAPVLVNQTIAGFQDVTDLRVIPSGGFEIDWVTDAVTPGIGETLTPSQRSFDAAGQPVTDEVTGRSYPGSITPDSIHLQQTLQLDDGTVVKVLRVASGTAPTTLVVLQLYDQSGASLGDPIYTSGDQPGWIAGVVQLPDHDIVLVEQPVNKTGPGEIFALVLHNESPPAPAPAAIAGTDGDDTLVAGSGNRSIDGGAGTDTVVIAANFADVQSYSYVGGVLTVTTANGTDAIANAERIQLSDSVFALDTQAPTGSSAGGHVWQAAALFHAGFGVMPGTADLSHWTAVADHAASMGALAQQMIDTYAPGVSTAALVTYLYQQLVHEAPGAGVVQGYVDQVGGGKTFATQGDLLAYAATLSLNADHVSVVGTIQQLDPAAF